MRQPITHRGQPGPDHDPYRVPSYIDRESNTIVQGSTVPMQGPAVRALYAFGLIFIIAATALAAYIGYGWGINWAIIWGLIIFCITSFMIWRMTVIVASGNWAARMEIAQRNKIELRKLRYGEQITARQMALEESRQLRIHELEMEKLAQEKENQQLRLELATARHGERVAHNAARHTVIDGETTGANTTKGYVTGDVDHVRQTIMDYLFGDGEQEGIFTYDGLPNPDYVDLETGKLINHTIPWSTRGALKAASARDAATAILKPSAAAPLVFLNPQDKSWYLNIGDYSDADSVQLIVGEY